MLTTAEYESYAIREVQIVCTTIQKVPEINYPGPLMAMAKFVPASVSAGTFHIKL
jgi:hypothetical protein